MTYRRAERVYGADYDADRSVVEDADAIRRKVRAMAKDRRLPGDWTYSVRHDRYRGGQSITMRATSPRPIYAVDPDADLDDGQPCTHPETDERVSAWVDKLTVEARRVHDTLEALHRSHNHDGSDTRADIFDVKFYGDVNLTTAAGVNKFEPGWLVRRVVNAMIVLRCPSRDRQRTYTKLGDGAWGRPKEALQAAQRGRDAYHCRHDAALITEVPWHKTRAPNGSAWSYDPPSVPVGVEIVDVHSKERWYVAVTGQPVEP